MVRLGSARIDENGNITGGAAGDQTGKEVAFDNWYLHSKGWYVLRAKDSTIQEKLAYAMERACNNNYIGYDQAQRYTAYDWCKYNNGGNYDPGLIHANVEVDCSALVRLCLAYAGIFVSDFYTGNEASIINATGKFDLISDAATTNSYVNLKRGDILVTRTSAHTGIVVDDGDNIVAAKQAEAAKKAAAAQNINTSYSGMGIGEATALTDVNVRSGNGVSNSIVGMVKTGQKVEVLAIYGNGWYKVVWPGASCGYAYTSNVGSKFYSYTSYNVAKDMTAITEVYIRKGPGTTYATNGTIKKGEVVSVLRIVNGWAQLADARGYSSAKYLQ